MTNNEILPIDLGIAGDGKIYHNPSIAFLTEEAIKNKEGHLSNTGALVIETGKYTGRSPDDKFIVDTVGLVFYTAILQVSEGIPVVCKAIACLDEGAVVILVGIRIIVLILSVAA